MKYYISKINFNENYPVVFSANDSIILKKKDVVVVPAGEHVQVAEVIKEISAYKALSEYDGIETIVCKLDLTEFNRKNAERIKLRQIEEIMEEKVEQIKKMESYRKLAEKSPEFKELFKTYEELINPAKQTESSSD